MSTAEALCIKNTLTDQIGLGQRAVLPFARKFPCKRKFWYLQGKMQGNKIDKEIARKSSFKQRN
jgi:hypothetical protein